MLIKLLFLLFSTKYVKINCAIIENQIDYTITPGTVETFQIIYNEEKLTHIFGFGNYNKTENDLIVHFYSINCNIKIKPNNNGKINENEIITRNLTNKNEKFKNMYSFRVKNSSISESRFKINYILNNNLHNNYICPLVINTIEINNEKSLKIEENSPIILFFEQDLNSFTLKYKLPDIKPTKSMFLSFSFQEITFFEINIFDNNKTLLNKTYDISYSSTIFLTNELNSRIKELNINIKHNDKYKIANSSLLKFEIVSNYSKPKLLEKNYLNREFITSNEEYRYFYIEINERQAGEIMLHDKRGTGVLIGSIVKKESSDALVKNFKNYPKINNSLNTSNYLEYDQHIHKLSFNFEETKECEEGCFILISYYHEKIEKYNNISDILVGYEFTLLLRIWDDDDNFKAQIIKIPYNEYILGCFDEDTVKEHRYSIYLTDQTDNISIQVIGESIIGSYRVKSNRLNKKYEFPLNLEYYYKNALNIPTIEYKNNNMILTFKPKTEEEKMSFYYFRILQANGEDYFISPLDSNLENICEPHHTNELQFCIFILKNDFKSFIFDFSVFPSNQNQLFLINYQRVAEDNYYIIDPKNISFSFNKVNTTECEEPAYNFINEFDLNGLKYILFIISYDEIKEGRLFGLLSTFYDNKKEIYPNIYSSEMFQLFSTDTIQDKYLNFALKYNFSITFSWLKGEGIVNLNNYFVNQTIDINYYGKYYKIPIMESGNNFAFYKVPNDDNNESQQSFIFCLKLEYSKREESIEIGNTLYEFIQNKKFPLYYLLPSNENDGNIIINFKIMNLNIEEESNFEIQGQIIDSEKAINYQEIKDFSNSTKGEYDICTKIGILNIFKNNKENEKHSGKKYVYIKINPKDNNEKISNVFIQILAMGKGDSIVIPINQYILRSFSSKDEIHNFKIINQNMQSYFDIDPNEEQIIDKEDQYNISIELLSDDNHINLDFYYENDKITKSDKGEYNLNLNEIGDEIPFSINCTNTALNNDLLTNKYYMIRYYSVKENDIQYNFNSKSINIKRKINSFDISLDNLEIIGNNDTNNNISFKFYFNLFEKDDNINKELLEVLTPISIEPKNTTKVRVDSEEEKINITLYYDNIKEENTYLIQIKVNVNKNNDYFYTKNLVYVSENGPKDDNENFFKKNMVLIIIISVVILFLALIICLIKMKKKNKNLEEILKSSFLEKEEKNPKEIGVDFI